MLASPGPLPRNHWECCYCLFIWFARFSSELWVIRNTLWKKTSKFMENKVLGIRYNQLLIHLLLILCNFRYFFCLFVLAQQHPSGGHGLLIHEVSRSHLTTHHSRQDSSRRQISSSQRPLPDNTTRTTDRQRCPRWDSNTQSQHASGHRPTPYSTRPLEPES